MSNKKSQFFPTKLDEQNSHDGFILSSKLIEDLFSNLQNNVPDKTQLDKVDQGLYELIKKNFKGIVKSQLYSDGHNEDDRNFNS